MSEVNACLGAQLSVFVCHLHPFPGAKLSLALLHIEVVTWPRCGLP